MKRIPISPESLSGYRLAHSLYVPSVSGTFPVVSPGEDKTLIRVVAEVQRKPVWEARFWCESDAWRFWCALTCGERYLPWDLCIGDPGAIPWSLPILWAFVNVTVLTSSPGSNVDYTIPSNFWDENNQAETIAGGGSGSSAVDFCCVGQGGSGGGGGAYARTQDQAIAPGTIIVRNVGTGGTGASGNNNAGHSGGNTFWAQSTGFQVASVAGAGGNPGFGGTGGLGGSGSGSTGTLKTSGGTGGGTSSASGNGGGGGGAGGPNGNGAAGAANNAGTTGGKGDAGLGGAGGSGGGAGGAGSELANGAAGAGGGGGGAAGLGNGGAGGAYGAGGGGSGFSTGDISGAGHQGVVISSYTQFTFVSGFAM